MKTTAALAVAIVLVLVGCAKDEPALAPPCPNIVIVRDIATLTRFKPGEGRDLTDVVLEAKITGFDGTCETDFDEGTAGEVEVDLRLLFSASRGPAINGRSGSFRYFVAIADREDNPLRKHIFETSVEFPSNRNRVAPFEELSLRIPLREGENGGDYSVLVGFQLTPEQVEYNRARQTRQ